MPATSRTQLPPRLLPVLYFGVAHVAFALACLAVAIVHLVTLGWITASSLSAPTVSQVSPVALAEPLLSAADQRSRGVESVITRRGIGDHDGVERVITMPWNA